MPEVGQGPHHRRRVLVGAGDGALDLHHGDEERQQQILRPGRQAERHAGSCMP